MPLGTQPWDNQTNNKDFSPRIIALLFATGEKKSRIASLKARACTGQKTQQPLQKHSSEIPRLCKMLDKENIKCKQQATGRRAAETPTLPSQHMCNKFQRKYISFPDSGASAVHRGLQALLCGAAGPGPPAGPHQNAALIMPCPTLNSKLLPVTPLRRNTAPAHSRLPGATPLRPQLFHLPGH